MQQHVLGFHMTRFEGKRCLRQFQGGVRFAVRELLLHQSAHTDKPGLFVVQELFVYLFGLPAVARHFSGLGRKEVR